MKKQPPILPVWAPRVKPYRIRRLYESDALGMIDDALLDEVGWALHARCESFVIAGRIKDRVAQCPQCRRVVASAAQPGDLLACPDCGWACTFRDFWKSIQNGQLSGGPEVAGLFQEYLDAYPSAKEPAEKMVLIDQLIHGFHHFLTSGRTRRPVAVNLIDGHLGFVIDFLDRFSYGPGSTPGTRETQEAWREHIQAPAKK